jgi:hypothetical protein
MPRDVTTRGNLTYDMLSFAYEHKAAVKSLTSDLNNDLHEFELNKVEWQLLKELCDILAVSLIYLISQPLMTHHH